MKIVLVFLSVLWFAMGCTSSLDQNDTFSLPAEWEAHDAVWVSFFGGSLDEVAYDIVKALAEHVTVKCIVPRVTFNNMPARGLQYVIRARLRDMGVDMQNIEFVHVDHLVQPRDHGPVVVTNRKGALRVVDFRWNNYGEPETISDFSSDSYQFDSLMAVKLGLPRVVTPLVMEGGAMEVNGKGTLLQVEAVTLQRNAGMSKAEIEVELKKILGQQKVIWLKEGIAEDPNGVSLIADRYLARGVGGHVDEFCRFVDPHTILLAFPDSVEAATNPVAKITYERMKENYEILKNETDQDGKPFNIIKAPVPILPYSPFVVDTTALHPSLQLALTSNATIQHGDTLQFVPVYSYLNFLVTNEMVLIPEYWKPGLPESVKEKDARFRELMQQSYPDRKIIPIKPHPLNENGGGIHCWTQQLPSPSRG